MRAARHDEWGSPLTLAEVTRPEPAAGEVRVAMRATSVNPIDVHTGRNSGYEQSMQLPFVPGWDVAGVVDAVGYGVPRHQVGDPVFGLAWFPYPAGTYAEYVTVPAHHLIPMPSSVGFVEAGCAPMAVLTAWQMLDAARVRPGSRVLIDGAGGGVGHVAVQLAAARGAKVVALARTAHHERLHEFGAAMCVDYDDAGAVAAIGEVDHLIDYVGHEFGRALFEHVAPGGSVALATAWSIPTYREDAAARGIDASSCLVEPDPVALTSIATLMNMGILRIAVDAEFPLERAPEAQQWAARRGVFGKTAIVVDPAERS
ncbi:MAG TPA: NADP-dependent oxidoreductase [Nocardia sp.]|uniref:NADP-dependent oxidoreductase n=1 Tax=Nocardia sp. TaxID=1821 RepID=UPI002B4B15A1|nr:NADP-dependent oxidoreductase [Nocardia sp.]HLS75691.1 NADP-dependent oxidoreductase [Nocardia sp.]